MRTVFDLVGKFRKVIVAEDGTRQISPSFTVVLVPNLEPSQCTCGTAVLRHMAISYAQEHIIKPGEVWFEDWDLVEKHVADKEDAQAA